MSDDTPTVDDLLERIEQLEYRVRELETADADPSPGEALDRYDATVLQKIEENYDRAPNPREMVTLYESAGVRDRQKIKQRHKHLVKTGRIETAVDAGGGGGEI